MGDIGTLEQTVLVHGIEVKVYARPDPVHGGIERTWIGMDKAVQTPAGQARRALARRRSQLNPGNFIVAGSFTRT
jgi:hypothetical protein